MYGYILMHRNEHNYELQNKTQGAKRDKRHKLDSRANRGYETFSKGERKGSGMETEARLRYRAIGEWWRAGGRSSIWERPHGGNTDMLVR